MVKNKGLKEQWYALLLCLVAEKPVTIEKALNKMGCTANRGGQSQVKDEAKNG